MHIQGQKIQPRVPVSNKFYRKNTSGYIVLHKHFGIKGNVGLTPGKTGSLTDQKTASALQRLVTTNSTMNHVLDSHSIKGHQLDCVRPKTLDVYRLVIRENTTHTK